MLFGGFQELIFISRSMRIIQANNQALGAPVDRINILAREAAKSLREIMLSPDFGASHVRPQPRPAGDEDEVSKEIGKKAVTPTQRWVRSQWMYLRIRAAIAGLDVFFSLAGLFDVVLSYMWSYQKVHTPLRSGLGGEIEERMKDMAKEFGVELDDSMFEG
jgi:aarF domain-containing kinase